MNISIAIDGPAGAGKSTIAKRLAKQLQFIYFDTGAMYRAMAYYLIQHGLSADSKEDIVALCSETDISITHSEEGQQIILNGENITPFIRTEEVGNMASVVSANADVRKKLVAIQQSLAANADVIMDGRDIGTCVLPNATLKIFLTATPATRAKRRYLELMEKGMQGDLAQIEQDIKERDLRDMNRAASPLKQAEDAILVDASELGIEEVVERIMTLLKEHCR